MLIPADEGLVGFELPVPTLLLGNQSLHIHCTAQPQSFFELLLLTACFLTLWMKDRQADGAVMTQTPFQMPPSNFLQ